MKRTIIILCTICLLALLAGCGAEQTAQEAAPAEPVQTAEPVETAPQEAAAPEAPAEPEPAAEPTVETEPETPAEPEAPAGLELALSLTGQDTAGLLEQLGEPLSQSYEESCSGPGDDGIWQYEGFIVFTYREDGAETVVDAEAD